MIQFGQIIDNIRDNTNYKTEQNTNHNIKHNPNNIKYDYYNKKIINIVFFYFIFLSCISIIL